MVGTDEPARCGTLTRSRLQVRIEEIKEAAERGNLDAVQRLALECYAYPVVLEWAILAAGCGGQLAVVQWLADRGAEDPAAAMTMAAENDFVDVVRYLADCDQDGTTFDQAIEHANRWAIDPAALRLLQREKARRAASMV